jgi:outer membrane scaffolding protein for murein synthesis (MipA/OmpV family)
MKKLLLFLMLIPVVAFAQSNLTENLIADQVQTANELPEHSGDKYVGVYLAEVPKYQGSDEMKTRVVVDIDQVLSNGVLLTASSWKNYDTYQIGKHLSSVQNVDFGVVTGAGLSRSALINGSDGSKNSDWMPFVGTFFKYQLAEDVQFNSELLFYGGRYSGGMYANLNAVKSFAVADHQTLSFSVGTVLGNQEFADSQFGISASQSAAYGYPSYRALAGVEDAHAGVNWHWNFNSSWMLNSSVSVTHLTSNVSGTRQVQTENNGALFVGLAYRF